MRDDEPQNGKSKSPKTKCSHRNRNKSTHWRAKCVKNERQLTKWSQHFRFEISDHEFCLPFRLLLCCVRCASTENTFGRNFSRRAIVRAMRKCDNRTTWSLLSSSSTMKWIALTCFAQNCLASIDFFFSAVSFSIVSAEYIFHATSCSTSLTVRWIYDLFRYKFKKVFVVEWLRVACTLFVLFFCFGFYFSQFIAAETNLSKTFYGEQFVTEFFRSVFSV